MAKPKAQLLLQRVEVAAHNLHRTKEIPHHAVTNHIGPVQANGNGLAVVIDNERHHIASAKIDTEPQRLLYRFRLPVTQQRRVA